MMMVEPAAPSTSSTGANPQRRRRRAPRRVLSPPMLPPSWGQDVAPPPTPFLTSPELSPVHSRRDPEPQEVDRRSTISSRCGHDHRSRRQQRRVLLPEEEESVRLAREAHALGFFPDAAFNPMYSMPAPPAMMPPPPPPMPYFPPQLRHYDSASSLTGVAGSSEEVVTYSYRFTGDQVNREALRFDYGSLRHRHHQQHRQQRHRRHQPPILPPPPNSQSSSPVTTGSSPEAAAAAASNTVHTTSPASPAETADVYYLDGGCCYEDFEDALHPVSILRNGGPAPSKKSVQWVSDGKRKPISKDRKVVKNQVQQLRRLELALSVDRIYCLFIPFCARCRAISCSLSPFLSLSLLRAHHESKRARA